MASTFHGLETAKRSIFTTQTALNTTGHNISNANTVGYSRQRVNFTAARPIEAYGYSHSTAAGQLGTGVEASSITRVRDKFLDSQFYSEYKWLGNYTVQGDTLEKLEAIVNEPSDTGLQTVISNFWNSWSDISKTPESSDGRAVLVEQTKAMMDAFNYTYKQLTDLKSDLSENAQINLDNLKSISSTIASLNGQIQRIEGIGDDANDLRDQRDALVDELSGLANVKVSDLSDGYTITMGNMTLVAGDSAEGSQGLTLDDMTTAIESGDLDNGAIYGTIQSRDKYVQGYMEQLDQMANTIANGEMEVTIPKGSVLPEGTVLNGVTYTGANRTLTEDLTVTVQGLNGLHQLGYTMNGEQGEPLFTDANGNTDNLTAANIQLNPKIAADPTLLATSMKVTINADGTETIVAGNNSMAVLMSQARDTKFSFDATDKNTINGFFRSVVGQLGVQSQEMQRLQSNQKAIVEQVDSRRMSVSGVSLDEEMSDLVKFQHAYNASARVMTVIDETLDRIINSMGRVGL
ncbi:flagellar hook-associated protein FlgK [Paenibacillus glycanilyticus]|uniref:flagellar hook-associated protein FlgK n=1 Tax=Paenibacillus glycanilyticus TaxID=126569 RepID=UPI00203F9BA0|nr:flagellar hook-associated protein FlgK [Paenibacillus glycanilyticus]MCM3628107.1 flagellar hook-associated protein FlgK [Paenibacillus glycanilyticus]